MAVTFHIDIITALEADPAEWLARLAGHNHIKNQEIQAQQRAARQSGGPRIAGHYGRG